ncbi:hypothetical protein ACFE04_028051 [Oxalis oulophora]
MLRCWSEKERRCLLLVLRCLKGRKCWSVEERMCLLLVLRHLKGRRSKLLDVGPMGRPNPRGVPLQKALALRGQEIKLAGSAAPMHLRMTRLPRGQGKPMMMLMIRPQKGPMWSRLLRKLKLLGMSGTNPQRPPCLQRRSLPALLRSSRGKGED